jgi:N-acetylmuramoyl-L-alanine amidase
MGIGRRSRSGAGWMALLAATLALLAPVAATAQQASGQRPVRTSKVPESHRAPPGAAEATRTRFIIGVERAVEFKVSALANPNRVLIDLPSVKLELPSPPGKTPVGVVKSFQHGFSAPGRLRIVIEVTGPVVIERSAFEKSPDGKSDNLVLDIVAASETAAAAEVRAGARGLGAAGLQPPVPKPAVSRHKRAAASCKPVIVIDPGHGGEDSGARKWGTIEKNVVLSFSLKFREKLAATGRYRVLMTRDTDVFVPLDERRLFAERHRAALFIAIHADYAARATARGATIYSLRPHVADTLRRSAERESADRALSGVEMAPLKKARGIAPAEDGTVKNILADLAHRDIELTKARTSVLARSIIGFMGSTTNLMDNPDRNAAFNVLKTAKVPAILLELGYLTNEADAQQLRSDQWRDRVSSSLVTAIGEYFRNEVALRVKADASDLEFAAAC